MIPQPLFCFTFDGSRASNRQPGSDIKTTWLGSRFPYKWRQTVTSVILPQCIKRMLPPWMNLYAILLMATPLASIVGAEEALTNARTALQAESDSRLLLPIYAYLLSWFFIYCYPIARLSMALERRFAFR